MGELIFQDILDEDDFLDEEEEEIIEEKSIVQKQDVFHFVSVLRQPFYEHLPGTVKENILSYVRTIPFTDYMNAEALIAAILFMSKYKTLSVENFNDYLPSLLDKKVNKYDLLKYIRMIELS